mmetsp:Transcript_25870/g.39352  ORF Transcript_25870/g.39352 Transcript_25870/m.39352 type:complete len:159 (-) Transcript_25870:75-551(-)|eukprot:CAMPEP_0194757858 /NCGR_PEP_ID=MMETSP0323_2-20130528/11272_1 /TAXON_ID=2866 ORGANISM="Crypthecodinium cohnii, Strain Seligo" /NCGR_SAMPLE_ID=MMETSP0323_2 /ASSEMBLY_ACC=CAM_ASM_000346 /LENGTH=158 /DNA_ID=CAMNT_0039677967 /DNA_START=16 /DNA_END=492 /DNA_ORIENTATION=-
MKLSSILTFAWALVIPSQILALVVETKIERSSYAGGSSNGKDPLLTDEDRLNYAKTVLEKILDRYKASVARDMTKGQYCTQHAEELETSVKKCQQDLLKAMTNQAKLEADEEQCGVDCPKYHKIQLDLINARKDVDYQRTRIGILNDQIEALGNWCSV